jgi:hypothetical protein
MQPLLASNERTIMHFGGYANVRRNSFLRMYLTDRKGERANGRKGDRATGRISDGRAKNSSRAGCVSSFNVAATVLSRARGVAAIRRSREAAVFLRR